MGIYVENTWKPQWSWATAYTNDSQPTTFTGQGVPVSLTRSTNYTIAENIGMDLSSYAPEFDTLYTGLYYLNVSASFSGGGADNQYTMFFSNNGIELSECQVSFSQLGENQRSVNLSGMYRISGDGSTRIDVKIQNDSGTDSITLENFTMSMIKLF